jgi:DNA-binding CsgD family transcriptional regulator
LATGDRVRAETVVTCAEHLAASNAGFASVGAAANHARGLLDGDAALLSRAAADYQHPWSAASAHEDAGVVLASGADQKAACTAYEQALAGYEEVGAERDSARLRSRLRELGVRTRHWTRAVRPGFGWASLTDAEHRVVGIVAEGLTNQEVAERLFLSRHTVDFHLRQVFRKLGIRSRVELTRLVLQHGQAAAR